MYKQYEQIISNIENHLDIDYKRYLLHQYEKKTDKEKYCNDDNVMIRKEIIKYECIEKIKIFMKYIIPTIVLILMLVFSEK